MSWLDTIRTEFSIQTGDGREYFPKWMNATKNKEFNTSEFEFVGVSGTLVHRGSPKGRKYNIEIYFDGDNHQDIADQFDDSCDDPRNWTIKHPKYGTLIVSPSSLTFDDRDFNVTKITGTVTETITNASPKITVDPANQIILDQIDVDAVFSDSFVNDVSVPSSSVKNQLTDNVSRFYKLQEGAIKTADQAEAYFNAFTKANAAILQATILPTEAINAVQVAIEYPFRFTDSVKNRLNNMVSQFNTLVSSIETLTGKSNKKVYENNGGILVSSMCAATVTNYDYANRREVIDTVELITQTHGNYITGLDQIQDINGGSPDSFIPDMGSQQALSDLVSETVSSLLSIAQNAKQERSFYLEDDSNIILLTHRLFGLLPDDSTIQTFMDLNDIGLNELLGISKGRLITYYF